MLVDDQDWSKLSDSDVWHAAQGGAHGAGAELRKRELAHRSSPGGTAALVARAKARK